MFKDLSGQQKQIAYSYALEIIEKLPIKAIAELMSGYGNDLELLLSEILNQVSSSIQLGRTLDTEKLQYLEQLEMGMDVSLKKLSYNYFKTTVLHNFHQGWRNLEWGNMVQLYPWLSITAQRGSGKSYEFCFALPLWRLYSYDKPNYLTPDTIDNHNRKETLLVTNVEKLSTEHSAKIIEEIKFNDILGEKLNPNNKAQLGTTKIISETGSILHVRGVFGFSRGLHTGMVIGDDLPDESSLYSSEQRSKIKERVYGTLQPIVEPGGYFIISGTPYHEADVYNDLKKDPNFKFFEYPAIFPYGRLLSPDRFSFEKLMKIRKSVGSIVFSREYLVMPMTSDSSIFPREFLLRSTVGMENIGFVENKNEFPMKLKKTVLACDFAISGRIGSDYSVFVVIGIDFDDNFYLLHIWRKQSDSYSEQVNKIVSINQRFKPNRIVVETNGFQKIMGELVKSRGIKNVKEFTTGKNKKDSYTGLPSLSAMFERYQIKIPYKEGDTRNMSEKIFSEFESIGYIEDKGTLESTSEHDDIPMAMWIGVTDLLGNNNKFKAYNI